MKTLKCDNSNYELKLNSCSMDKEEKIIYISATPTSTDLYTGNDSFCIYIRSDMAFYIHIS